MLKEKVTASFKKNRDTYSNAREISEVSGDYAGYAQLELEQAYSGATALFFQGCCGDIDPIPRGAKQNAVDNGKELSQAVQKVLSGSMDCLMLLALIQA